MNFKHLLFLLLIFQGPSLKAAAAADKLVPFSKILFSLVGDAAKGMAEEFGKDAYTKMKSEKPVVCKPFADSSARRRFTRRFAVGARGVTTCNVTPHSILQVSHVEGAWKCCSETGTCSYVGYDANPHGSEEHRKNYDHKYLCLLSDESASAGTPVVVNYYIPSRRTQLNLWSNDSAQKGEGSLQVTLLVEEGKEP